jgi:hypothetical protein
MSLPLKIGAHLKIRKNVASGRCAGSPETFLNLKKNTIEKIDGKFNETLKSIKNSLNVRNVGCSALVREGFVRQEQANIRIFRTPLLASLMRIVLCLLSLEEQLSEAFS